MFQDILDKKRQDKKFERKISNIEIKRFYLEKNIFQNYSNSKIILGICQKLNELEETRLYYNNDFHGAIINCNDSFNSLFECSELLRNRDFTLFAYGEFISKKEILNALESGAQGIVLQSQNLEENEINEIKKVCKKTNIALLIKNNTNYSAFAENKTLIQINPQNLNLPRKNDKISGFILDNKILDFEEYEIENIIKNLHSIKI